MLKLTPSTGYLEGMLGATSDAGPFARLEAGWRPRERLGLFGYGQVSRFDAQAGLGARLTF